MPAFFSEIFSQSGLQQLGRGEHALDVVVRPQDRQGLLDAVVLVVLQHGELALLDQADDPARIEVDAEADAAADLGQVLDGQPQPPRPGGTEHEPVRAAGKVLVVAASR